MDTSTILIIATLVLLAAGLTLNRKYERGDPKLLPAMVWLVLVLFCLVKARSAWASSNRFSIETIMLLLVGAIACNKFINRFSAGEAAGARSPGLRGGWEDLQWHIKKAIRKPLLIIRTLLRRLLG